MILTNLWVHFVHCHVRDIVVILEEGNQSHPQCPKLNMFMPWQDHNGNNSTTELCKRIDEHEHKNLDLSFLMQSVSFQDTSGRFGVFWGNY